MDFWLFTTVFILHFERVAPCVTVDRSNPSTTVGDITDLSTVNDIPSDVCKLILDYNNFPVLPAGYMQQFVDLEELHLDLININTVEEGSLVGLTKIRAIRFDRNDIATVPPEVNELVTLESLSFYGNWLRELEPRIFEKLVNLRSLHLGSNRITHLAAGWFHGLDNLEYLTLTHNDIPSIPACVFVGLNKLKALRINYNEVTTISPNIFGPTSHPVDMQLDTTNNDWNCDYNLCWLKQAESEGWLKYYSTSYDIECATPPELVSVAWDVLNETQLGCDTAPPVTLDECSPFIEAYEKDYNTSGAGQISVYKEVVVPLENHCALLCDAEGPKCTAYSVEPNDGHQGTFTCEFITQPTLPQYKEKRGNAGSLYSKNQLLKF